MVVVVERRLDEGRGFLRALAAIRVAARDSRRF